MPSHKLASRVVLVTGVNNPLGIGAAIARACAAEGARLALAYRPPVARSSEPPTRAPGLAYQAWLTMAVPDDLLAELQHAGCEAQAFPVDLSDPGAPAALFAAVVERFGVVDELVNNAAVSAEESLWVPPGARERVSAKGCDRHFAVNARAPALLMAAFADHRSRIGGGGAVLNVSTDAARGHAGAVSYGASKAALESYTRAAAWEFGPLSIRVNAIAPGPVQTGWIDEALRARLEPTIPLRRVGNPADIAKAAVFLLSDDAAWITGQVLHVNGGHVMA